MRITLFCPSYGEVGGIETIAASLAREFVRAGHEVSVLARGQPANATLDAVPPVARVPLHQMPRRARHVARQVRFAWEFQRATAALLEALRDFRTDVVLTLAVTTYAPYFAAIADALPTVVSLQGGEARGEFTSRPRVLRHALGRVAHVVACATPLAAGARAVLPVLGERVTVVPNGVDPGRFADGPPFPHPRPYVFAVGRLVRQKGFDVLLEAFARVARTHGGVDLLLAGDGAERSSLEAAARAFGPDGPVHLLGQVDSPTVAALCRGALFVVCPSRWEGLPVVCLEAMASGRALVASRVDGIPDAVVHGESGLLVPPDDPGSLADAIVRLLDDDSERSEMGRAGHRRVVERFSWQQIAREYLAILESVVSPGRAAARTASAPRHPPA